MDKYLVHCSQNKLAINQRLTSTIISKRIARLGYGYVPPPLVILTVSIFKVKSSFAAVWFYEDEMPYQEWAIFSIRK
jgi:hypothetical protein